MIIIKPNNDPNEKSIFPCHISNLGIYKEIIMNFARLYNQELYEEMSCFSWEPTRPAAYLSEQELIALTEFMDTCKIPYTTEKSD